MMKNAQQLSVAIWFWLMFMIFFHTSFSQHNIPLEAWRFHASGEDLVHLAGNEQILFAASNNAVFKIDHSDNSIATFHKENALSDVGISALHYQQASQTLWIAYSNGNVDFLVDNEFFNFNRLVNPPDVTSSVAIRHINSHQNRLYFSTAYGVVVFDAAQKEVRESWRNLGVNGQLLGIRQSAILGDSIYLATDNGILAGKLSDNLQDFNMWTRYSTGDLANAIQSIISFNGKLYAACNNRGIFRFTGSAWVRVNTIPLQTEYTPLTANSNQLLIGGSANGFYSPQNNQYQVFSLGTLTLLRASFFSNNQWWITDGATGLYQLNNTLWQKIPLPGMAATRVFSSFANAGTTWAVHGGYQNNFTPAASPLAISKFENGSWLVLSTALRFASVFKQAGNTRVTASFGDGIEIVKDNTVVTYNISNSVLQRVTDIELASSGWWLANYNSASSLVLLKTDNTLQTFTPGNEARLPVDLVIDAFENIWMIQSDAGAAGVTVVDNEGNVIRTLSESNGFLPDPRVYCGATDRDGNVWLGTAQGVCYFTDVLGQANRPIVEGRFLLSEERITSLVIDGGNRKWFGTQRGLWLFDDDAEVPILNFTKENSPLPSSSIRHLSLDPLTGELFVVTDAGMVSFRTDATEGNPNAPAIKIFPNPVLPEFTGKVGIEKLVSDASVKIVTADGKLIKQLTANGGTASWDLTNFTNNRVNSGVYFVLTSTSDGVTHRAGKIIVVR
ncbi:MAG: T9SS type A sorting domain-containing protein [Chryseotalea sp.]